MSGSYTVHKVMDASQAIDAAKDFKPHGAIADLAMPTENGFTIIRRLRADFPDIRIVTYSGWCDRGAEVRAISAGADRFLKKPARIEGHHRRSGKIRISAICPREGAGITQLAGGQLRLLTPPQYDGRFPPLS
jgi:DNA-binding NarL/FixJ family response regulator